MLIRFRVKNFLSFKEQVELSMIPGKIRQHANHVISGGQSRHAVDALRSAVIYGPNASGKSNLVKAMDFAHTLITEGTKARQSLPVRYFKLEQESSHQPSRFEFEIRTRGKDYLYGFEVNTSRIVSEWLHEIKLTTLEQLFERKTSPEDKTVVEFEGLKFETRKEKDFLNYVAMGTRANQLFLTECMEKNIQYFQDVFLWFATALVIIFPEARFGGPGESETNQLSFFMDKFDTGICGFEMRPVNVEDLFPINLQQEILADLSKGQKPARQIAMPGPHGRRIYLSLTDQGELVGHELAFRHKMIDGQEEIALDLEEESDGTIRLIDLIPVLYQRADDEKVFVIDELDRSLHPLLCYQLLDLFLKRANSRTQIIVTTHESSLLTNDLLRRDEIWFTNKDQKGSTSLYSLEEFSPRYDKDIQKGYLFGRFGAVPILKRVSIEGEKGYAG